MGAADNPRWAFNDKTPKPQYDPSWGAEGYAEEVLDVKGLAAGPARISLRAVDQPQVAGKSAKRFIDFVYLTSDTEDAWRPHYARRVALYPILDAVRDSQSPRWELQVHNRSEADSAYAIRQHYNRIPWGYNGPKIPTVKAGTSSGWLPLTGQDTTHFSMITVSGKGAFDVELRPVGGESVHRGSGDGAYRVFVPTYTTFGETPITPEAELTAILKEIADSPAVGRSPTEPLCYGGWIPIVGDTAYNRAYADLYWAMGLRGAPTTIADMPSVEQALGRHGFTPNRSLASMAYRNPPIPANIEKAKTTFDGRLDQVQWFDYGDEIHFSEWVTHMTNYMVATSADKQTKDQIMSDLWLAWLAKNRPGRKAEGDWMKPNSAAATAAANPALYVDSAIFYEDVAIEWVAERNRAVKDALGEHVLGGANYACHPFYYPSVAAYVKWFRKGAGDYGRHSEYFWQTTQAGPMINGYVAEHFHTGMRDNPQAILRQYTMPHSPGNIVPSFLRTAFSHVAHGAKTLDYFGVGMNECFTENHIDHRYHEMYVAIRDVTHSIGLVDDVLLESTIVPSRVGLVVSDSTERWDTAPVALDRAGHSFFGAQFRETRLTYHQERFGIWQALTFAGHSPDLLVEADLNAARLAGYDVVYLVGDHLPADATAALDAWVRAGGTLMATAGAGRYDMYMDANPALQALLGIASRELDEQVRFVRPLQELPFLTPIESIKTEAGELPVLAIRERVQAAAGIEATMRFADGSPAVLQHTLGEGTVIYAACLPGLAHSYSAQQPPRVPDRSASTHVVPEHFDPAARALILRPLAIAEVAPQVAIIEGGNIDTRLIDGKSAYILPIANYNRIPLMLNNFDVLADGATSVVLSVRTERPVTKATSAYLGNLAIETVDGRTQITIPKLGYGDMIRLD